MQEAKEEFRQAWERKVRIPMNAGENPFYQVVQRTNVCERCGNKLDSHNRRVCWSCRIKARAVNHPPCFCGRPFYAKGLCQKHYCKEYNKARIRKKWISKGLCPHCGHPVFAKGVCGQMYQQARKRGVSVNSLLDQIHPFQGRSQRRFDEQKNLKLCVVS